MLVCSRELEPLCAALLPSIYCTGFWRDSGGLERGPSLLLPAAPGALRAHGISDSDGLISPGSGVWGVCGFSVWRHTHPCFDLSLPTATFEITPQPRGWSHPLFTPPCPIPDPTSAS